MMELWYENPASKWEEALPIGNGRMGAMVTGGTTRELIYLNEDSIWSGGPINRINKDAAKYLPEIRKLIHSGNISEAEQLSLMALGGTPNSERSFEPAGELEIIFKDGGKCSEYRRSLCLDTGCTQTVYRNSLGAFTEEWFASCPDQVIACHMTAQEGTLNFRCRLDRCHNRVDRVWGNENEIGFEVNSSTGIPFAVRLMVRTKGGTLRNIGEHLLISDAAEAELLLDIQTSFYHKEYLKVGEEHVKELRNRSFEQIRETHLAEYKAGFGKCSLKLGGETACERETLPTDQRILEIQKGASDPGFYALYFQYGRYLLFSSSRGNCQPANLQGVWNKELAAVWDSKYTININAQMNYWIAESGNLSSCHLPFFNLLSRVCENGKKTAREMYGCKGSVAHHNTDIYGDTAPQDLCITSTFWAIGEAWMATHIYQHFKYTGDLEFLRDNFEILQENVDFLEDFLIENEAGELVTSPSISPENTYIMKDGTRGSLCEGPTMDVEILTELLTGYVAACKALNKEPELAARAERILERLPKLQIGKYGQLREWREDYDEAEPGHRHISHLYGVYPGTSISFEKTPELMKAARVTLERRLSFGGGHTGWSRAWIIGLWAHFREGKKVYENLQALIARSTFPNLMDNHPYWDGAVFQIDGNMGAAAAMIEMLVQCKEGVVKLLPALPEEFSEGSVRGICLPGGLHLDMTWKESKVTDWKITRNSEIPSDFYMTTQEITVEVNDTRRIMTI